MSGVRRVTILEANEDGTMSVVAESRPKRRKRKRSRMGKAPERNMRRALRAMRIFVDDLEERHDRSARKKKDGWMADFGKNSFKANRKAMKQLRRFRVY